MNYYIPQFFQRLGSKSIDIITAKIKVQDLVKGPISRHSDRYKLPKLHSKSTKIPNLLLQTNM